jgi:hypothetical protein
VKRLLCAGLLLLATEASAAEAGFAAMGAGTTMCVRFNEIYAKDPVLAETIYYSWATGYISGLNEALILQGRPTRNMQSIPIEEQKRLLRGLCRSQPEQRYQTGVRALFSRMRLNPVPQASPRRNDSGPPPKN